LRTGATPQPVTGPPPQPLLVLQPERAFIDRTRDVPEWPVRP
jgi:hypothetical protein